MSEFTIGWIATGSGLGLLIASTLYWFGGRAGTNKLWRRLGSALILAITVLLSSFLMGKWHISYLLVLPLLWAAFSIGYGGDNMAQKLIRRSLYALGVCSAGLVFCFVMGGMAWGVLVFSVIIGMGSVWLGTRNPFHASFEEFIICILLNLGLISYPFISSI